MRNGSAQNFSARCTRKRPSRAHTAPYTPMFLRVGACSTTGSRSFGGTHMVQLEPCGWKWHSSSNQISRSRRLAIRSSFFISPLRLSVGSCNDRARLPPSEPKPVKKALALMYAEIDPVLGGKVMAEQLTVPEILAVAKRFGRFSQVRGNGTDGFLIQGFWPARSLGFLQPSKAAFLSVLSAGVQRSINFRHVKFFSVRG